MLSKGPPAISFDEITRLLPHRYPVLFVDRVLEVEPGKRIRCLKNVTGNECFFSGHLPGRAIVPGTVLVEALAQCGLLLFRAGASDPGPERIFLLGAVEARFLRLVTPGDQVVFELTTGRVLGGAASVQGTASVDGVAAVKATLTFAAVDPARLAPEGGAVAPARRPSRTRRTAPGRGRAR